MQLSSPFARTHTNHIRSALEGFEKWSAMKGLNPSLFLLPTSFSGAERGRIMFRAAQLLRDRNEELAMLEVLDTGKFRGGFTYLM
jgi:hypothetical protein